jgi:hypothetical protein
MEGLTMAMLRVMSSRGDDGLEYDPTVDDERLRKARSAFQKKLREGYLAFVPDDRGDGATQIRRFDRRAKEIVLQPPLAGG